MMHAEWAPTADRRPPTADHRPPTGRESDLVRYPARIVHVSPPLRLFLQRPQLVGLLWKVLWPRWVRLVRLPILLLERVTEQELRVQPALFLQPQLRLLLQVGVHAEAVIEDFIVGQLIWRVVRDLFIVSWPHLAGGDT